LAYKAYNDILTSVVDIHALPICFPPIGRYQKTRKAALGNGGVQRLTFKEKPKLKDVRHDTFVVTRWNITQQHKCLTIYTACLFNYDDDEYKPVWPSGLWATSQGSASRIHVNHTRPS
jgi:hypothetical protein